MNVRIIIETKIDPGTTYRRSWDTSLDGLNRSLREAVEDFKAQAIKYHHKVRKAEHARREKRLQRISVSKKGSEVA